jgi:outer membrane protein OmpA-like peptidoglycan-associated protein
MGKMLRNVIYISLFILVTSVFSTDALAQGSKETKRRPILIGPDINERIDRPSKPLHINAPVPKKKPAASVSYIIPKKEVQNRVVAARVIPPVPSHKPEIEIDTDKKKKPRIRKTRIRDTGYEIAKKPSQKPVIEKTTDIIYEAKIEEKIIEPETTTPHELEEIDLVTPAAIPAIPVINKPEPPITEPIKKPEIVETEIVKETIADEKIGEPDAAVAAEDTDTTAAAADETDSTVTASANVPRPPIISKEDSFEEDFISISFQEGMNELDNNTKKLINDNVLSLLLNNPDWRVQIQSFASSSNKNRSDARRTSLSRALSVRSHLIDHGVEASRMDVRALGTQTNRQPTDRIDLVFFNPYR